MLINRYSCLFLLFIFAFFYGNHSLSQEAIYQSFTTKEGLPSNEVYHVYQDVNGLMWFATDRGIASYDGYEFKTYTTKDGLPSNVVFKFYPQADGTIWCTTANNRFFYFHPSDYTFHEYKYNKTLKQYGHGAIPADMKIDSQGTLYVSFFQDLKYLAISSSGEILKKPMTLKLSTTTPIINNKELTKYRAIRTLNIDNYPFIYSDFKKKNTISPNHFGDQGLGVTRFDKVTLQDHSIYLGYTECYITKGHDIIAKLKKENYLILIDKWDSTHFWISSQGGGLDIHHVSGEQTEHLFDKQTISHVTRDHQGGIWISSLEKGVHYSPNFALKNHKAPNEQTVSQVFNNDSTINIITYDKQLYTYRSKKLLPSYNESNIHSAEYFEDFGHIKITNTFTDISRSFLHSELIAEPIQISAARKISDNKSEPPIQIGQREFIILEKDHYDIYSTQNSLNDACHFKSNVLVAHNDGLDLFDLNSSKIERFDSRTENINILDIDNFNANSFVAATRGHGIVLFRDQQLRFITQEDGLVDNHCNEVYIQNDSTIWACTSKGLNKIILHSTGKKTILTYSTISGLLANDILDFLIFRDTAWIASRDGLSLVSLKEFQNDTIQQKTIFDLIGAYVNDSSHQTLTQLSHDQNRIEFNFRTISFISAPVTYRYRLKGLEEKWNETDERKALYESIPPGEYTFEVQTAINNIWQEKVIQIPVSISPPFHKTWWFTFIIFTVIGTIIYLFFRYRILSYNWDISREILRRILKRLSREDFSFTVESNGQKVKIESFNVLYVEAQRNYIEIHTVNGRHLVREKISNFTELVPDSLEYLRISRSCVIRIDKVVAKSKNSVTVDKIELKVGKTYADALHKIHL